MSDIDTLDETALYSQGRRKRLSRKRFFVASKRCFDLAGSGLILLPICLLLIPVILVMNARWNKGPLIYKQERMGLGCKPFTAYKFRTMTPVKHVARAADDPLETNRITRFGQFLRKSRIDELPQLFNILKGDMSLIGPRPDFIQHARDYVEKVEGYQARHSVRPGISGLAQVELGYIEGIEGTKRKVELDLQYIQRSSFRLDTKIALRTVAVILRQAGA